MNMMNAKQLIKVSNEFRSIVHHPIFLFNFQTFQYVLYVKRKKSKSAKNSCQYMMGVHHRYFDRNAHFRSLNDLSLAFGSRCKISKNHIIYCFLMLHHYPNNFASHFSNVTQKSRKEHRNKRCPYFNFSFVNCAWS